MAERARALGGKAVVVTFDPHPLRILRPDAAPKLLTPLPVKLKLLEQTGVDAVLVLPFTRDLSMMTAEDFARQVSPSPCMPAKYTRATTFTSDIRPRAMSTRWPIWAQQFGFEAKVYSEQSLRGHHVSSSEIRKLMRAGEVGKAQRAARTPVQHRVESGPRTRLWAQVHGAHRKPGAL